MLEIKRQVLHLVRVHLKVPGWLKKALLTRKLPMFLSRLNEIHVSGGREKMCLVQTAFTNTYEM